MPIRAARTWQLLTCYLLARGTLCAEYTAQRGRAARGEDPRTSLAIAATTPTLRHRSSASAHRAAGAGGESSDTFARQFRAATAATETMQKVEPFAGTATRLERDANVDWDRFSLLTTLLGPCRSRGVGQLWGSDDSALASLLCVILAWLFKNLKVISDAYLIPAGGQVARDLGLPSDLVGAALLHYGSGVPLLCINTASTLLMQNECGVGGIIGSAILNILLVVGITGISGILSRSLTLLFCPPLSEFFFYIIMVIELLVSLVDGSITMQEAQLLIATYLMYCAWSVWHRPDVDEKLCKRKLGQGPTTDGHLEEREPHGILYYDPVEVIWRRLLPSQDKAPRLCFLCALLNVAGAAYLMTDTATRLSVLLEIPSFFTGLVILASGVVLPDACAALDAMRRCESDGAVSKALGSNVSGISLGLGVPWLIALALGRPVTFLNVHMLVCWVTVLLVLVLLVSTVVISDWHQSKKTGLFLMSSHPMHSSGLYHDCPTGGRPTMHFYMYSATDIRG